MAYTLNGVEYPSVTTITGILDKPALLQWAANCAVDYIKDNLEAIKDPIDVHRGEDVLEAARKAYTLKRDEAAGAGTAVHNAILAYIQCDDKDDPDASYRKLLDTDEAYNGFMAFRSWESKNHVEWLENECEVFSVLHGYAGRFDAIAKVNGHRYLLDFKTSSGVWPEMRWQVCAYRQAYNEMLEEGQETIENLAILHLNKATGEPTFIPVEKDLDRMTELFNYLVMVYYFMANRRLKNNRFVALAKGESFDVEMPF
jgi:hypothetical protein